MDGAQPSEGRLRTLKAGPGRLELADVVSPAPRSAWRSIVDGDLRALPSQTPEWTDALLDSGRFTDVSRWYCMSDGRQFVVPLVRRRGPLRVPTLATSLPNAWGTGGIVGSGLDPEAARLILPDLFGSALRVQLRPNPMMAALYRDAMPAGVVATPRRAHALTLPTHVGTLWNDVLSGRTRRSIARAERGKVKVETDTTGRLIPVFQQLLEQSVDRWAGRQHEPRWLAQVRAERRDPPSKWPAICARLDGRCEISVARIDGRPVCAIIMLYGATAHYTRAVMNRDLVGTSRANYLLLWNAMKSAVERGCTDFHMGESGTSPGLAQFKEHFGAVPIDHADYAMERIPVAKADALARGAVKRVLRFED